MRNIFKQIKSIFIDNKEYFIKCTLMSIIAALILGLVIGLSVPASAVEEPTESDQVIIPAGTYEQIGELSSIPYDSLSLSASALSYESFLADYGISIAPALTIFEGVELYVTRFSPVNTFGDVYVDGVPTVFYSFVILEVAFSDDEFDIVSLPIDDSSLIPDFIVEENQSVPILTLNWFNSNFSKLEVTPTENVISAGYYKVRDSWNTSGFPVTNDSIHIRYYSTPTQSYVDAEGIAFLIENDTVEIYYQDIAVYADGWNEDGAKNIQVMQDVTVGSDFYTVFNSVYAPSSEGTNEFDSGYAAGYADGRDAGYDIGYRQGYAQGLEDGDTNIFVDIIGGTLAAVDSFTIFGGFSLLDLISTLLGGMALVWILKLLAGG